MATKNILLVEGIDDQHVVKHLFGHHGIEGVDDIIDKKGISYILDSLHVEIRRSDLACLGIIIDADYIVDDANNNLIARWISIRDRLRSNKIGYSNIPDIPGPAGTIIEEQEGLPRIGIWLMPNNSDTGMLEDFVGYLVPDYEHNLLWHHVNHSLNTIPDGQCRFPEVHRSKARIHTWLAWQEEPGKPLGQAIRARYLQADAPEALRFIAWIRRLFQLPEQAG